VNVLSSITCVGKGPAVQATVVVGFLQWHLNVDRRTSLAQRPCSCNCITTGRRANQIALVNPPIWWSRRRHRTHDVGPDSAGNWARELSYLPTQQHGWIRLRRASALTWSSDFGYHHTKKPDRHRSDVQRLDDKVYAQYVREYGTAGVNAGTLSSPDLAITVPASVMVPATVRRRSR